MIENELGRLSFIYNQHLVAMLSLVNGAKVRKQLTSGEKHHILPRVLFKKLGLPVDNTENNLVLLTEDEHKRVHKLLSLCCTPLIANEMKWASTLMSGDRRHLRVRTENWRKGQSERMKGEGNPMYGKSVWDGLTAEERKDRVKRLKNSSIGHKNPESMRKKLSVIRSKANQERHWFNNGSINKFTTVCPEGFTAGRLTHA